MKLFRLATALLTCITAIPAQAQDLDECILTAYRGKFYKDFSLAKSDELAVGIRLYETLGEKSFIASTLPGLANENLNEAAKACYVAAVTFAQEKLAEINNTGKDEAPDSFIVEWKYIVNGNNADFIDAFNNRNGFVSATSPLLMDIEFFQATYLVRPSLLPFPQMAAALFPDPSLREAFEKLGQMDDFYEDRQALISAVRKMGDENKLTKKSEKAYVKFLYDLLPAEYSFAQQAPTVPVIVHRPN